MRRYMSLHRQRGHIPPFDPPPPRDAAMSTPPVPNPAPPDPSAVAPAAQADTGGFWSNMFVMDSRTGQPEFSKILAFASVLMLFLYQGFALLKQNAAFDPIAFAKAIALLFGGLATHMGVSEFFRQRFDVLNGIQRDGQGGIMANNIPPMMQPPPAVPDDTDNTPPASQ